MIKDWLNNGYFDGESLITWGQPVLVSNERNLTLAATEAPDALSATASVTVAVSLAATDAADAFAGAVSHPVGATWTLETEGVVIWPQAWITTAVPAREATLAATEAGDVLAATAAVIGAAALSATEALDTAAFTAEVIGERNADLAATEAQDTASFALSGPASALAGGRRKRPKEWPVLRPLPREMVLRAGEAQDTARFSLAIDYTDDELVLMLMSAAWEEVWSEPTVSA